MNRLLAMPLLLLALLTPSTAAAQEREVPYWASLRAEEVYMRVGPSQTFPIDWVYRRKGLPMKVVRLNEGWRLVEDPDGARGWIASSLLTPERAAIVIGEELAAMHAEPDERSELLWNVEPGVVGKLDECDAGWCRLDISGHVGWIAENRLWGAGEP